MHGTEPSNARIDGDVNPHTRHRTDGRAILTTGSGALSHADTPTDAVPFSQSDEHTDTIADRDLDQPAVRAAAG